MSEQPEADAHIRALLAELGSGPDGETMPPEVAARLDDTLARLVAERADAGESPGDAPDDAPDSQRTGSVVPLRRRWVSRMTTAAAAVIVLGAGGVAAANLGVFSGDSPMSADSAESAGDSSAEKSVPETAGSDTGATSDSPTPSDSSGREGVASAVAVPRVSAKSFASDVTALLRARTSLVTPERRSGSGSTQDQDAAPEGPARALEARDCAGPKITDGAVPNPIRYDGGLAVLVVHPERDGGQLVEAWTCDGDRLLAGTTVAP
jgi:hypothetical protein